MKASDIYATGDCVGGVFSSLQLHGAGVVRLQNLVVPIHCYFSFGDLNFYFYFCWKGG